MIFVTLGSQKFQFNRLLKEIDRLIEENEITEEVFAQIGYSDYKPKNYQYKNFLDHDRFNEVMGKCEKVITHGGTGAIVTAIKKGKKVIAVPRLASYGEHVDDHQLEIVHQFDNMNLILFIEDINELVNALKQISNTKLNKYISNTEKIVQSIDKFICLD